MKCISSVSYAAVVNGVITNSFEASRGLKQGDPLSPYLFLICTEGFSTLLKKAQQDGIIKGIQVNRGGPWINHLFFADDSLIFAKSRDEECNKLVEIIKLYEDCSG